MSGAAIRARGVRKAYGGSQVLAGIDLDVRRGEIYALLGPNGAGKTTLVRILSTLVRPDGGQVEIAGHDLADAGAVRREISVTGQEVAVDGLLTGAENLIMIGRLRRLGRTGARRRAADLLEQFGLVHAAGRRVKTYSGGMRRRLDIAMSLVARPSVIFLDEPTTGLDPRSRQDLWASIRALASAGSAVFLTTQYLDEADQLADRVMMLDSGRAVAEGTTAELKWQLAGEQVELVLADGEAYARAVTELGAGTVHADPAASTVRVATDGTAAAVRELLDRMAKTGIEVDRIGIRRPSLDDVFFALTRDGG